MIGRPASAHGCAAAAARDASLRLRHNGLPLRRDERYPSPRSAQCRSPPSASVSDLRESLLHRLRLRRAAGSPPTGTLPFASDARGNLRRLRVHGMDGSPSPPSSPASASAAREAISGMALSPSSASTTREALHRLRLRRAAGSPPPTSPPTGSLPFASDARDLRRLRVHGLGDSPSPPSSPASASAGREAIERAIRSMALSPSSSSTTDEALHRLRLRRTASSPPLTSPCTGTLFFASDARGDLRRLRVHGMGDSPSPPSSPASASAAREAIERAIRGMALSPSSASTMDEALHRLRLRRAASSPPLTSPRTRTLFFASDVRRDLCRLCVHGMGDSPSLTSSPASASTAREAIERSIRGMALSPSSASTMDEALHRLRLRRAASSPPLTSPCTGTLCTSDARGDLRRLRVHGMGDSPSPLSSRASASTAREAIERAICGMVLSPSSASTMDEALPHGEAPFPPLPSVPCVERPSASASATWGALDHAIHGTGLSPSVASATRCRRLLTQHQVISIATLRASLALALPNKPCGEEISGPVLIITNPEFTGSTLFLPYSMRTFTRSNYPIDTLDVLYSDGEFFLLKQGTSVSIWEVKSEKSLFTLQLGVHIEQGYFRGTPNSDFSIVLARQRVFADQIDDGDDEEHVEQLIVAEFWLRTSNGAWRQNAVVCTHLGIHSLIIHGNSLFWLSDDGTFCSVRQTENGLFLAEWEGAVESIDSSFSLVEHLENLYIVKSGGVLPNAAGIYKVVPGNPPIFPESRLNGKDAFIVHGKSGFLLPNQTTDSRVFSAPLMQDADCARFSYTHNRHDNIRPCQSELFHAWCSAAWAVM